jgi:hypothetical protein
MSMLICPDCRHENESERVYCHNCGARLSRDSLTNPKSKTEEQPGETQKRLRRMLDPRGAIMRRRIIRFAELVLGALVAAAIVLMIQPPDLPKTPEAIDLGPQIGLDIETAVMDQRGARLNYSQDQVNSYLRTALKRKKAALEKPLLHFERGLAAFDENSVRLTAERSLFGYSLYTTTCYQATTQDGKIAARNTGGSIGRLRIHPAIMKHLDVIFADIWKALDQDRKQVAKLAAIEFHPQTVVLTAAGR